MVRVKGVCVWRLVVCLSNGGFAPGFGMDHMGLDWACIPRGTRTVISGLETAKKDNIHRAILSNLCGPMYLYVRTLVRLQRVSKCHS